ncbi:hypothetical protein M422DRAFT_269674 [Sphaerobolus stellatus SS14]|uniref:Unplaced genomic scaffold SPHSTscaffold_218, whole genome shotgun sequence n=1 Tax=Sphaerobolus stellatus (strain SS14) TaxID=990650 RepID=A0A0C9THL9_SPHS4|nr:hypothetical protein M422DRAFT_269674 [Sphaerobolus stellatus SS14]
MAGLIDLSKPKPDTSSSSKSIPQVKSTKTNKSEPNELDKVRAQLEKALRKNARLKKDLEKSAVANKDDQVPTSSSMTSNHKQVKIPKPKGEAGRSGKDPRHPGYNLRTAMGLAGNHELYKSITDEVSFQLRFQGVESETIRKQCWTKLGGVTFALVKKFPFLDDYDKMWPINDMMTATLRNKKAYKVRKGKVSKVSSEESMSEEEQGKGQAINFKPLVVLGYMKEVDDNDIPEAIEEERAKKRDGEPADVDEDEANNQGAQKLQQLKLRPRQGHPRKQSQEKTAKSTDVPSNRSDQHSAMKKAKQRATSFNLDFDIDTDHLGIFVAPDGSFTDFNGATVDAVWNKNDGRYQLRDGRRMNTPAYPSDLASYEDGFNDGIQRSQNVQGRWHVGSISEPQSKSSASSRSRAQKALQKQNAASSTVKSSPIPSSSTLKLSDDILPMTSTPSYIDKDDASNTTSNIPSPIPRPKKRLRKSVSVTSEVLVVVPSSPIKNAKRKLGPKPKSKATTSGKQPSRKSYAASKAKPQKTAEPSDESARIYGTRRVTTVKRETLASESERLAIPQD